MWKKTTSSSILICIKYSLARISCQSFTHWTLLLALGYKLIVIACFIAIQGYEEMCFFFVLKHKMQINLRLKSFLTECVTHAVLGIVLVIKGPDELRLKLRHLIFLKSNPELWLKTLKLKSRIFCNLESLKKIDKLKMTRMWEVYNL